MVIAQGSAECVSVHSEGGHSSPHISHPTEDPMGGSTLPQWQNWRSLKLKIVDKFLCEISTSALPTCNHLLHMPSRRQPRWSLLQYDGNLQKDGEEGKGRGSSQAHNLIKRLFEGLRICETHFRTSLSTRRVCSIGPIPCPADSLWYALLLEG